MPPPALEKVDAAFVLPSTSLLLALVFTLLTIFLALNVPFGNTNRFINNLFRGASSSRGNGVVRVDSADVLLVIAHPDDESMFFAPTMAALSGSASRLHVLCLSTGNFDGLGELRRAELLRACSHFGIDAARVSIVDHAGLQDGPSAVWNKTLVSDLVLKYVRRESIGAVITFDNYGVSGHPNHAAVHRGVVHLFSSSYAPRIPAWELESVDLARKYSGFLDLGLSLFSHAWATKVHGLDNERVLVTLFNPRLIWRAMAAHNTQFVWFRRLFVIFSRYGYVNTLRPLSW